MCSHMNRTGVRSPCSKQEKLDSPILGTGRRQSGASSGCDEELFLHPSDACMVEKLEPRQLTELWWRVVDLIDEKEKETKN
jgi:hypothetical protein